MDRLRADTRLGRVRGAGSASGFHCVLAVATSTIHRMLIDGCLASDHVVPGAPWRIRHTEDIRQRLVEDTPEGYVVVK